MKHAPVLLFKAKDENRPKEGNAKISGAYTKKTPLLADAITVASFPYLKAVSKYDKKLFHDRVGEAFKVKHCTLSPGIVAISSLRLELK